MEKVERLLYRFGNLKKQIKECKDEIKELFAEKYSCMEGLLRVSVPDSERVKAEKKDDPVYCVVQKMVDVFDDRITRKSEQLRDLCFDFDEIKRKVDEAGLSEVECEYLRLRYIDRLSVAWIADKQGYSERQTQRIRKNLLKKLAGAVA